MAKTKSLYELKQEKHKKKNPNTITDADYYLRDKEEEAKQGYPNSIDMTPAEESKPVRKATAPKGE